MIKELYMPKKIFLLIILMQIAYTDEINLSYKYNISYWTFSILFFIIILILILNNNLRKKINIKELKNLEQERILLQKNKQAVLGNLIAHISHQWRDSLSIISSINLELQTKLDYGIINQEDIKKSTYDIEKSTNFMSDTMNVFLEFYKTDSIIELINIKDCIQKTIDIIEMSIKQNKVSINIIEISPLTIHAKNTQFMHIWFSLISNSINASKNKNIPTIKIDIIINKKEIIYKDNCQGMEEKVLKTIKKNEQSGLGLKIVKDILLQNNWDISYSNNKEGISFKMYKKVF